VEVKHSKYYILPILISAPWIYFYYLEFFNYDNYVFATFHYDLLKKAYLPATTIALLSIFLLLKNNVKITIVLLFGIYCISILPLGYSALGQTLARIHIASRGKEYASEKAKTKMFGNDLMFIDFLKENLDSLNYSHIIIPPNQIPWRHTGDQFIMNSLLYRYASSSNIDDGYSPLIISSEEDGASYRLWPNFDIKAKKIIIFNWNTKPNQIIENSEWKYKDWETIKPWGLIIR